MSPFFGTKIGENQEKGLRRESTGFSVQMRLESKRIEKTRSSPQITKVVVSHYNMVLPQMVSPGAGRLPLAVPQLKRSSSGDKICFWR